MSLLTMIPKQKGPDDKYIITSEYFKNIAFVSEENKVLVICSYLGLRGLQDWIENFYLTTLLPHKLQSLGPAIKMLI